MEFASESYLIYAWSSGCEHWHVYEKKETGGRVTLWLPPALSPSGALNSETKVRTKHAYVLCLFKTRIFNHTRSICVHRSLLEFADWQSFIMKLCASIFCWWAKNEAESVSRAFANICGFYCFSYEGIETRNQQDVKKSNKIRLLSTRFVTMCSAFLHEV